MNSTVPGPALFKGSTAMARAIAVLFQGHTVNRRLDDQKIAPLRSRLHELAALEEGWLDGEGSPPSRDVLRKARPVLERLVSHGAPPPRLFATAERGVQAEWTLDGREVSITFEPGGTLYAVSVNPASGEVVEPDFAADDTEHILRFVLTGS